MLFRLDRWLKMTGTHGVLGGPKLDLNTAWLQRTLGPLPSTARHGLAQKTKWCFHSNSCVDQWKGTCEYKSRAFCYTRLFPRRPQSGWGNDHTREQKMTSIPRSRDNARYHLPPLSTPALWLTDTIDEVRTWTLRQHGSQKETGYLRATQDLSG